MSCRVIKHKPSPTFDPCQIRTRMLYESLLLNCESLLGVITHRLWNATVFRQYMRPSASNMATPRGGFSYLGFPLKLVDSFRFLLKLDENTRQFHGDQVFLAVTGVLWGHSICRRCVPDCGVWARAYLTVYGVSTFARYRIWLTVNMLVRSRESLTVMITAWELTTRN